MGHSQNTSQQPLHIFFSGSKTPAPKRPEMEVRVVSTPFLKVS
jgi:hypothetical protein